jgi:hypothetical protein
MLREVAIHPSYLRRFLYWRESTERAVEGVLGDDGDGDRVRRSTLPL